MTGKLGMRLIKQDWQPCFTCPLRECDDRSSQCAYRQAINEYQNRQRKGLPISDELRHKRSLARYELGYERKGAA